MNLIEYDFPELKRVETFQCDARTDETLLSEAEIRGFGKDKTEYDDLFSELFFKGGRLNFKKNLDPEFKKKATSYLRLLMQSFQPSHEDKKAISALLLSELVDIEKNA